MLWFVFGTLLGPEATGPYPFLRGAGLFVSGFLASAASCVSGPFWGGWCAGCGGTGLLFENYIVDASIFYKKQFPRI